MKHTICGVAALLLVATGAGAQDLTWGCQFDRTTGKTYCLEVDDQTKRNTGRVIVSKPNVGLPGTAYSNDGRSMEIYSGGKRVGYEDLGW